MPRPSLTRVLGGATAAYSVALLARPRILLDPCGLPVDETSEALARCIGARDVGIGLAMLAAPAGPARRLAVAARVVSDWGDAAALTPALRSRGTATKVGAFAIGWGALCALAGWYDEHH